MPYAFSWNDGNVNQNRTNIIAGTYTVTTYDAATCSVTASITITEPSSFNVSIAHTNVVCNGGNTGTISLSPSGGTTPYNYVWNDGNVAASRNFMSAGTYAVTVSDNNSCTFSISTIIAEPNSLSVVETHTNILCSGVNTGAINIVTNGGTAPYTFNWNDGNVSQNRANLSSSNYAVTITDNNLCSVSVAATITQPTLLTASQTHVNVLCNGANTGLITIAATGGTNPLSFIWIDGVVTQNRTNLIAGNYSLTVTDNNSCSATVSATITQPTLLTASQTHLNVLCNGANTGLITITVTGGTNPLSFIWNDGVVTQNRTNLIAGNYSLTVTDNNLCSANTSVTLTQPTLLNVSETHIDVACNGGNTGSINIIVSGATSPYTFIWNDGVITEDRNSMATGNYSVTINDNNLCSAQLSVSIGSASGLNISETHSTVTCNGLSDANININVTGGSLPYTFMWNDATVSQNRANIPAGNYSVSATDNNGCIISTGINIAEPTLLNLTQTHNNVLCKGGNSGSINITATGATLPYTYVWNDGTLTEDRNNIVAGNYSVTTTDNNSCSALLAVVITEPSAINISETHTDILCNGGATGSINITSVGGTSPYTYYWNDGGISEDRSNISIGNYLLTVTDNNLCTSTLSVNIVQPAPVVVSEAHGNVLCHAGNDGWVNLTTSGGILPYTFVWNTGSNAEDPLNMVAGNYSVTVNDNNACSTSLNVSISEPTSISTNEIHANVSCMGYSDGAITISISGGTPAYFYLWNDGVITQNRINVPAGNYAVTVTDNNLCTASTLVAITEPAGMNLISSFVNPTCETNNADGSISLNITGGSVPYIFNWSNGTGANNLSGLEPGNYLVTVTDANNCTVGANFSLVYQFNFSVDATPSVTISMGESTTLGYILTGIAGNYVSVWSPSSSLSCSDCVSPIASPVATTEYQIKITNQAGCIAFDTVTVYIVPDYSVFIPNVFTPNGDGNNDVFEIYGNLKGLAFLEIQIFNRWGEKVFESNNHHFKWDGTFKGEMQNPSVFVWQLKLAFLDGHREELRKGSVTLVR